MNWELMRTRTKSMLRRGVKPPVSRLGKVLLVGVLAVMLAGGLTGYFVARAYSLPNDAALRYGDRVVTVDELDARIQTMRALYGVQPPGADKPAKLDRFRRDAAKSEAVSLILDDAARDAGIVIADKTARDSLTRFVAQQGSGSQGRDQFIKSLGEAGTSERVVLDEIKRQLAVVRLFDHVTEAAAVTNQQVRAAFDERRQQLATPEKRGISNIVVREKSEAQQLVGQLRRGTPFAELAGQQSLDGATRSKGGDLGELAAADLEDSYAKVAFSAPLDGVFGPVQTRYGWNVGRIDRVVPSMPAAFEKVQDGLKQQLELEHALHKWRGWLTGQLRDADIEYAESYRPAQPDEPPSASSPVGAPPAAGAPR